MNDLHGAQVVGSQLHLKASVDPAQISSRGNHPVNVYNRPRPWDLGSFLPFGKQAGAAMVRSLRP